MTSTSSDAIDAPSNAIYILDMGREKYGDCVLCRFGSKTVLIDGGHLGDFDGGNNFPSIPDQLRALLGQTSPLHVSLLIVTHLHSDHVGCLPTMVQQGLLTAEWALVADENLGTGHPVHDAGSNPLDASDIPPTVRRMVAALREESRADVTDATLLSRFFSDAETVEARYRRMLRTLEEQGTRVVRYGRDDYTELVADFADVGMRILGPTDDHLLICTDAIERFTRDAIAAVSSRLAGDAPIDEAALYRSMAAPPAMDAADALDRPGKGAALNDQSIVLRFEVANHKVLLLGDMQLAKAEVSGLDSHMRELRDVIRDDGPYSFVKLSHHTSYNGVDEELLDELAGSGRVLLAHSGGIVDSTHPDPGVLSFLRRNRQRIGWARTDRNGLITVNLNSQAARFRVSRGQLNDFTPNSTDQSQSEPGHVSEEIGGEVGGATMVSRKSEAPDGQGVVEVIARIPHASTRVTLTIDVEPRSGREASGETQVSSSTRKQVTKGEPEPTGDRPLPPLRVGDGRPLPPLLFVTSRQALETNIGRQEAAHLLGALRASGQTVYDSLPSGLTEVSRVAALVRGQMGVRHEGVVILGGYDVVPAQRLDTLDEALRNKLPASHADPDNFVVWSDDVYGDRDGDGLPEVPVSRIPDGRSPQLIFAAVQAGLPGDTARNFGVRNAERPFAEDIFSRLPGAGDLLVSQPTGPGDLPDGALGGGAIYLMLHGGDLDGSRFWGEDEDGGMFEAINVSNVAASRGAVAFTGCCWGALCAATPAAYLRPGQRPAPRPPESSMALSFLRAGALAFVGCTGAHYSPITPPFDYFGAPMHRAFWRQIEGGSAPARALFRAKIEYLEGIPHGRVEPSDHAIEMKILRQYACLGLGW